MRAWIDSPRAPSAAPTTLLRPALPPPPPEKYMSAYAIFEGGGAKGITHVGALAALEREKIALVGVAGSSAGAIVAALIAVGYTAREIYDLEGQTNILWENGKLTPVDLLGKDKWLQMPRPGRSVAPRLMLVAGVALGLLGLNLAAPIAAAHGHGWLAAAMAVLLPLSALWAVGRLWEFVRPIVADRGYFNSTDLRTTLNDLLREKLAAHYKANGDTRPVPEIVRFADIDPDDGKVAQCRRLKIIVSDTRTRTPCIFDRHSSASVADAVAASASIPLVFAPPAIDGAPGDAFVDGGLVANLPVWAFAREKRRLERRDQVSVPIFAFTLGDVETERPAPRPGIAPRFLAFMVDVIRTGIFGSQAIAHGFTADLVVVPLPSSLPTLAFDCSPDAADRAYVDGFDAASVALARRRLTEALLVDLLTSLRQDILDELHKRTIRPSTGDTILRVCVIDPVEIDAGVVGGFRVVASVGMLADADDRLEIDGDGDGAPRAWHENRPFYNADLTARTPAELRMTKYEHALVWKGLKSMIAVPIYTRPDVAGRPGYRPQHVLCIDSNCYMQMAFDDQDFMSWLIGRSGPLSKTVIREAIDEQFKDL